MSILHQMVQNIPIPQMVAIRQKFNAARLADPIETLRAELRKPGAVERILPDQSVAIAVGSRGIANMAAFTKATIEAIYAVGGKPFIVPCMGSHGGATAQGQKDVLRHYGITEQLMGAPIHSSMEVIQIGKLPSGLPIYVDQIAAKADAIVVMNRVKPHTAFRGQVESGILKMISIGLGKQKGAEACHQMGFKYMAENVLAMSRIMISKLPIVFGVAIVENAYDETSRIEVLPIENVAVREPELLVEAKANLPQLLFGQIDVLVIDYIGKNISGDGMDPNVTGRYPTPYAAGGPQVSKMAVLDLTPETKGNANGVGTADFTTQRVVDKMDLAATYANGLTSTVCDPTKIPTTMQNQEDTIKAAIKTSNILDYNTCRLVRIRDTLHLGEIEISLNLVEEARNHPDIEILSEPYKWVFNEKGDLF